MTEQDRGRVVLLAGATGLVGGNILQLLLNDPGVSRIHALSRRPLKISHPKLQVLVVDFTSLPPLPDADEVYLALGTTIKVAASKPAFRAVDFDANMAVARAALSAGVKRTGLVSAAGASARSAVFYNQVKGELEDALKTLPFAAVVIARPGLLLGSRRELGQPLRVGERIASPLARLLSPLLPGAYKPVEALAVARSLVNTVPQAEGIVVLNSEQLGRAEKKV